MNKRIVISSAIVTLLVGTGIVLAISFPANQPPQQSSTGQQTVPQPQKPQPETAPAPTTAPQVQPGSYKSYSQQAYVDSVKSRRILFFHAPWCPQCRQLDKEISANTVPSGIAILKVDYDTNQPLRAKYGVTLQTTFVEVDANDAKVKSVVAYNEPTYVNLAKQLSF